MKTPSISCLLMNPGTGGSAVLPDELRRHTNRCSNNRFFFNQNNTCFSSGDGEDIARCTGGLSALGKHADVVCRGIHLYYCGLGVTGSEVHSLCVIP